MIAKKEAEISASFFALLFINKIDYSSTEACCWKHSLQNISRPGTGLNGT